ncbi:MAG: hypothetical protein HYY84_04715 [Deltaproteobacteria bacterium]|nr:hypothetical protein [Deltaproteobacteria bacterium]
MKRRFVVPFALVGVLLSGGAAHADFGSFIKRVVDPSRGDSARPTAAAGPTTHVGRVDKKSRSLYLDAIHDHREILWFLQEIATGREKGSFFEGSLRGLVENLNYSASTSATRTSQIKKIADFASACDKWTRSNLGDFDEHLKPATACQNSRRAAELFGRFVDATTRSYVRKVASDTDDTIRDLREKARIPFARIRNLVKDSGNRDRLMKNDLVPAYTLAGLPVPADILDPIKALDSAVEAALKKTLEKPPARSPMLGHLDKAVSGAVKAFYAAAEKNGARAQTVRSVVAAKAWRVYRNRYGIPLQRQKVAEVTTSTPDEPFCRRFELTTFQTYYGGGRYEREIRVDPTLDYVDILRCK